MSKTTPTLTKEEMEKLFQEALREETRAGDWKLEIIPTHLIPTQQDYDPFLDGLADFLVNGQ